MSATPPSIHSILRMNALWIKVCSWRTAIIPCCCTSLLHAHCTCCVSSAACIRLGAPPAPTGVITERDLARKEEYQRAPSKDISAQERFPSQMRERTEEMREKGPSYDERRTNGREEQGAERGPREYESGTGAGYVAGQSSTWQKLKDTVTGTPEQYRSSENSKRMIASACSYV